MIATPAARAPVRRRHGSSGARRPEFGWIVGRKVFSVPTELDELLLACSRGDPRGWNELVDRFGRLVYSVARRAGLSEPDCEDVFQTVFSALYCNLSAVRDPAALPQWLITTAQRAVWRRRRAERAAAGGAGETWAEAVDERSGAEAASLERAQIVDQALRELGGRCEELLRHIFVLPTPASYDQAALRLEMPLNSVGPTRRRCLEKLVTILNDRGDLEDLR